MSLAEALAASLKLTPEQYIETAKLFRSNSSEDMVLTREKMKRAMARTSLHARDRNMLDRLFTLYDRDGVDAVDFFEFAISGTTLVPTKTRADSLQLALQVYDLDCRSQLSKDDISFIIKYFTNTWKLLGDKVPQNEVVDGIVDQSFDMWNKAQVIWSTGLDGPEIEAIKDLISRLDVDNKGFVAKEAIMNAIDVKLGLVDVTTVEETKEELKVDEKSMMQADENAPSSMPEPLTELHTPYLEVWKEMLNTVVPDPEPPQSKELIEQSEMESKSVEDETKSIMDNEYENSTEVASQTMFSYHKFLTLRALTKEFASLRPLFDRLKTAENLCPRPELAKSVLKGIYTPDDVLYGAANYDLSHLLLYKDMPAENMAASIYRTVEKEQQESKMEDEIVPSNDNTVGEKNEQEILGTLEVAWTALPPGSNGESEFDPEADLPQITEENPLLGQPCTYKFEIRAGQNFSKHVNRAYCQYTFNGTTYQTERLEDNEQDTKGTTNPAFQFSRIHHVECVDQQFVDALRLGLQIKIFINNDEKLPDIPAPSITKTVRAEWEKIASNAANEDDYLSFRQYQALRIAAGVDTEPQEREWLNYESLMDGGYSAWLSTEVYKCVGSKK